jgi:transcriptional regulator with XRE-family HTH domain
MDIIDFYTLSDKSIQQELGERLRSLRLRKNKTQEELAKAVGLSLNSIKALEAGRGKLAAVVAVLRELQALEQLNQFLPEVTVSPLQLAKRRGRERLRASGERLKAKPTKSSEPW